MIEALKEVLKEYPLISIDAEVMCGQPCIKGTRLSVWVIIEQIAQGGYTAVFTAYPQLNIEQIRQAFAFACAFLHETIIYETAKELNKQEQA